MDYIHVDDKCHVMHLTEEESDQMFDAFDPYDENLPSHLHRAGHRFIKVEVYEWLVGHVGEPYQGWYSSKHRANQYRFMFDKARDALLFKLTFAR